MANNLKFVFLGFFIMACMRCICGCQPYDGASEAEAVVCRTFGKMPENVEFVLLEKTDTTDKYLLVSDGKTLTVKGTSSVAICKGFYDYILENGYGVASWSGNRLEFPDDSLPVMEKTVVSPFRHHLFYNVCTFGYTMPFWDWDRWEKEIDWLALHGFDMPLAPIAGEAIFARVWKRLGLSDDEIREYFCGPAHLPWMRMGNMSALDGGMGDEWHEGQIKLQHKILKRMRSLGMAPVCQGFAGFVPKALKEHMPDVDITITKWQGLESYMLSPLDDLFTEIGKDFILEWEKEFGKGTYYLIDSFNEMDIPFGPKGSKERFDTLRKYGETIYRTLADVNPDAVWVMQGWMFGYSRNIWDPESVKALLCGVPDDKMMIIDLAVDFNEYVWKSENSWDYLSGFFGKEWIWSTVPNFGGRTALKGPLDFYLNGHLEALSSENRGKLSGFGTSPEGTENNEILYELISRAGWSASETSLDDFLKAYTKARYGSAPDAVIEFWSEMRRSVYDNFTNNARFLWQQRPAYHRGETMEINEHYFSGIERFLSVSEELADSPLYVADAVQYAALYLAAKADYVLKASNWAIVAGDTDKAERLEGLLFSILSDADRLLESHPVLRMERWLDYAEKAASSPEEAAAFVKEGKRLVTTWAGPSLKDYSCRVWSGLIRDFYVPRLKFFYRHANKGKYADMVSFENEYHYGTGWGSPEDVCPDGHDEVSEIEPFGNPLAAAVELVGKYSSIKYGEKDGVISGADGEMILNWNEYAPENEVGYWMPQDFKGRDHVRLYTSIMSDDYLDMNGVELSGIRGDEVVIENLEFVSGHDVLGTVSVNAKAGGGISSVKIPCPVFDRGTALEREVKLYVTIRGSNRTCGMIALY